MPRAPQSLYSQLWERGGKQTSLEFSLKCRQTLWGRHFWRQTVPSSCRSDGERLVAPYTASAEVDDEAGVVEQEVEMCGNKFFVPNPSHFNEFIPIHIRNLNPIPIFSIEQYPIPSHSHSHSATQPKHLCIGKNFFLRAACLCWPTTNSVRPIKESKRTNDHMNWQHAKKLNANWKER